MLQKKTKAEGQGCRRMDVPYIKKRVDLPEWSRELKYMGIPDPPKEADQ